jgi:hypothetical protein
MPELDRVPAILLTSMAFFEVSLLSVCQATIPQNRQTAFTHTGTMVDNCIDLDRYAEKRVFLRSKFFMNI